MTTQQQPVSVGRLLAMDADTRATTIRALSPIARRKLARLAALGAREASDRALDFLGRRSEAWTREQITAARDRADIAAALTTEEL